VKECLPWCCHICQSYEVQWFKASTWPWADDFKYSFEIL